MDNQEQPDDRLHDLQLISHDFGNAVSYVQAFVLGHWYAILRPLIRTDQMPYQGGIWVLELVRFRVLEHHTPMPGIRASSEVHVQTATSSDNDPPYHTVVNYHRATLASFYGGAAVRPAESMANSDAGPPGYVFDPIFVNLQRMRDAEVVLLCMYSGWTEKGGINPVIVIDDQSLENALRNFSKVVLFCGEPRTKGRKERP
ncbi:hypothetical protein AC579_9121 [Pseudocercospora musae]|uniref:Uncharacterized protein n=1 Tax=Pseudocercospora musae TaxID=113226 RepID=A0A139IIA9_9PEZI|nr:hypothetical protein AC579_9121 [Pseudocercospora musae]